MQPWRPSNCVEPLGKTPVKNSVPENCFTVGSESLPGDI
jgi:hypothetical protein